jgi:predicted transcriptional regulator
MATKKKVPTRNSALASSHPLAVALRRKGMTQKELADLADVQHATICRVLTGVYPHFSADAATRIYKVVKKWGIRLEDLVMARAA